MAEAAARIDLLLRGRIFVVADLENTSPAERARYLDGIAIAAESDEAGEILDALEAHGMRVAAIDRRKAFEDVRRVAVAEGEVLVEAGSPPAFVYVAGRAAACGSSSSAATGTSRCRRGSRSASPASCAGPSATARWSPPSRARC